MAKKSIYFDAKKMAIFFIDNYYQKIVIFDSGSCGKLLRGIVIRLEVSSPAFVILDLRHPSPVVIPEH
ncbi:MAG: hypothetical protein Q7T50_08175 [Candidatus Magasanikbacteria bacterium]|nr:hypothetical protein [Candidatus Magasanikbacteria bacterium]